MVHLSYIMYIIAMTNFVTILLLCPIFIILLQMYNVIIALPSFGLQDKFVHGMKLLEL